MGKTTTRTGNDRRGIDHTKKDSTNKHRTKNGHKIYDSDSETDETEGDTLVEEINHEQLRNYSALQSYRPFDNRVANDHSTLDLAPVASQLQALRDQVSDLCDNVDAEGQAPVNLPFRGPDKNQEFWLGRWPYAETCKKCDTWIGVENLRAHERQEFFCRTHRACFSSWEEHNKQSSHKSCPFCTRKKFATDKEYKRHFKAEHSGL